MLPRPPKRAMERERYEDTLRKMRSTRKCTHSSTYSLNTPATPSTHRNADGQEAEARTWYDRFIKFIACYCGRPRETKKQNAWSDPPLDHNKTDQVTVVVVFLCRRSLPHKRNSIAYFYYANKDTYIFTYSTSMGISDGQESYPLFYFSPHEWWCSD